MYPKFFIIFFNLKGIQVQYFAGLRRKGSSVISDCFPLIKCWLLENWNLWDNISSNYILQLYLGTANRLKKANRFYSYNRKSKGNCHSKEDTFTQTVIYLLVLHIKSKGCQMGTPLVKSKLYCEVFPFLNIFSLSSYCVFLFHIIFAFVFHKYAWWLERVISKDKVWDGKRGF